MKNIGTKVIAGIVVALIAVVMLAPAAYAQGPGGRGQQPGQGTRQQQPGQGLCTGDNFVDNDGDGVCDYAGNGQMGRRGMAGQGQGTGMGAGFVDNDGDGVCDYAGSGMRRGGGRQQWQP